MALTESLRHSFRQFRLAPMFAAAFVCSLALGVAATGVAFAVVKRAFIDPLPYGNADRVVTVQTSQDGRLSGMSIFVTEDLRASPLFSDIAPMRFSSVTYDAPDAAERLQGQEVTRSYFSVLGVQPALGSVWPEGTMNAAMVTWPVFQRLFNGDPSVIGRDVSIDGTPRTIVGVMPEGFRAPFGGAATGILLPLDTRALLADTARARRTVTVLALRADGTQMADVAAFMPVFSEGQRSRFPQIHGRETWIATPLRDDLVGPARTVLKGVGGASLLLMLIVWANIAGLSAAQAVASRRVAAVRAALGATASRLFRERLIDSLVLAGLGTAAGLWLSDALIKVAAGFQTNFLPNLAPLAFEPAGALVGVVLGSLAALISAVVPYQSARQIMSRDLLAGRGTAGGRGMTRLRSALVVVQVAIAIVLLIAGGLLVRTVWHLAAIELGFATEQLVTLQMNLPASRYQGTPKHVQFERDILERIRGIQGVKDATASVGFPAAGAMGARLTIMARPDMAAPPELTYLSVAPGFFSFLGLPIVAGRDIDERDTFEAPRVVVVNETMARAFWPAGDALGAKVKIGAGAASDREITVVGIVPDVRQHGPTQDVRPTAYGSTLQYSWPRRHISVKFTRPISDVAADVRAAVRAVDPLMAVPTIIPFDDHVAQQTARPRLVMVSLAVFGSIAAVLSGLGLYAVVALTAQSRRREFAIRLALGARSRDVVWLVSRQSMTLAVLGGTIGVLAATVMTRTLQELLYGVQPTDPKTFTVVGLSVLVMAVLASIVPATRASRTDPVDTLKAEA